MFLASFSYGGKFPLPIWFGHSILLLIICFLAVGWAVFEDLSFPSFQFTPQGMCR
jgi:uncharacterized membrane protein YhdT